MNADPRIAARFVSYAQNFEDVMLWRALGGIRNGFYIDVGAAHPVDLSVTNAFHAAGWRGVNIEPAAHYFEALNAARQEDVNLAVAVADVSGSRAFHEVLTTGLSTFDGDLADEHAARGWEVETRTVPVMTLAEICRQYVRGDIHFLKIDVEGAEGDVLAGADFKTYRPWIVLLEATRPMTTIEATDWEPAILAAGYVFVWFDGLNRFYLARERCGDLQRHFRLPPNSFDNFDKYDFALECRLGAQEQAGRDSVRRERDSAHEIRMLEAEVLHLRPHIHQNAALLVERRDHVAQGEVLAAQRAALDAVNGELAWHKNEYVFLLQAFLQLENIRADLVWPDGPRAVRLLLPVARAMRRLARVKMIKAFGRRALRLRRKLLKARRDVADAPSPIPLPAPPVIVPSVASESNVIAFPRVIGRHAVHQFHPGSAYGDAVTNSMLLTRRILRELGYQSEIFVVHRDPMLAGELLLHHDLPRHDEYVLIVLHSLGYEDAGWLAALPAPKILMYHNITPAHLLGEIPELARLSKLGRAQLDFWRSRISSALAVSEFNALELRRHNYPDVAVCPLLFDIAALRARPPARTANPDEPLTILFVGRVVESKGQDALVDAFGAFNLLYGKNCRLVLVGRTDGGGRYLADLYQRIGEQGLRRAVFITGAVSDDELFAWYAQADMYVSLSHHEGFGVPLIEAMARDVPVLAYATGAIPFTMQESGTSPGMLHSRDPILVAKAMLKLANEPAHSAAILMAQRANLDRFELTRHIPVLQQALSRAGASPTEKSRSPRLADRLNFTITGHFNGSYSLAAVNRNLASTLAQAAPGRVRIQPVEGECTDYLGGVPVDERGAMQKLAAVRPPASAPTIVISQHYPVYVPDESRTAADLTISYFFWEESLVPAATIACLNRAFDAVFAPSAFVAKALVDSGLRLPVKTIGYVPKLDAFFQAGEAKISNRRRPQIFTFLHVSSCFPRKGVDLLLNAFAQIFTAADPVRLIIKTFPNPHNETAQQIERLRARHPALPDIRLIERDLDEAALVDLYAESDAAILPSRGEGFNIPAAEAMAAALPLIITGAGGSADFVTAQDATLLPWQWEPSRSHLADGLALWFAPDEPALAAALRAMFDDVMTGDNAAAAGADHARREIALRLNPAAWTRRMTDAVGDLLAARRPRISRIALVSPWDVGCGVAEYTRQFTDAFTPLLAPDEKLLIIGDDRTAAANSPGFNVRPAWILGGAADTVDRLACAISQEDPHVLMIQHQPGLIGWHDLAALLHDPRLADRVVIVTLHATHHLLSLAADDRAHIRRGLNLAARVIVHTVRDLNLLNQLGLFANAVMVPQGAPVINDWQAPRHVNADDEILIGCYGFLLPQKGLGLLIEALPALRETWPNLRLRFVNALYDATESGAELTRCKNLAVALGVADHIEWITDFLPHENSMAHLRACDLIVLPYQPTDESSSAALRSSLASGTPVAVTPLTIFEEAGDAVSRFSGATAQALATGVTALLQSQDARVKRQEAARRWIAQRGWARIALQMHGMMCGLAVNRRIQTTTVDPAAQGAPASRLLEDAKWN